MEKITINGIEYYLVPRVKSELDLLKEKYESGDYIYAYWDYTLEKYKIGNMFFPSDTKRKLIHKKHKDILEAYLADNSVEIEFSYGDAIVWDIQEDFIDRYSEKKHYRLKPKQEYPIFKRNEDGEVFKIISSDSFGTQYETMLCKDFNERHMLSGETIPHDKETGLYHLQPVWCWDDTDKYMRQIRFYSKNKKVIHHSNSSKDLAWENIEPVTTEQLQTMPFIFEMYQKLLNESKN